MSLDQVLGVDELQLTELEARAFVQLLRYLLAPGSAAAAGDELQLQRAAIAKVLRAFADVGIRP